MGQCRSRSKHMVRKGLATVKQELVAAGVGLPVLLLLFLATILLALPLSEFRIPEEPFDFALLPA